MPEVESACIARQSCKVAWITPPICPEPLKGKMCNIWIYTSLDKFVKYRRFAHRTVFMRSKTERARAAFPRSVIVSAEAHCTGVNWPYGHRSVFKCVACQVSYRVATAPLSVSAADEKNCIRRQHISCLGNGAGLVLVVVCARWHQSKVPRAILGRRVVVIAQPHSDVRLNCVAKQAVSHSCRWVCNQCIQACLRSCNMERFAVCVWLSLTCACLIGSCRCCRSQGMAAPSWGWGV